MRFPCWRAIEHVVIDGLSKQNNLFSCDFKAQNVPSLPRPKKRPLLTGLESITFLQRVYVSSQDGLGNSVDMGPGRYKLRDLAGELSMVLTSIHRFA